MPVTMLTTPAGIPASATRSAKRKAESGVCSAGLRTTVQPAARAGAIFCTAIINGKFHGTICAATPIGSPRATGVHDLRGDADRLAADIGVKASDGDAVRLDMLARDLGRPAGHVPQGGDGAGQ